MKRFLRLFERSTWIDAILLLVVSVLVIRSLLPLFPVGFPATHDGETHIARMVNYAVALRQGQFPPRFAPSFWNGFGYPVFNFHYPLLNILGSPFVIIGLDPEVVFKVVIGLAWISLWIGTFVYVWQVTKERTAGLMGVLLLLMGPYFYTLVYVRGSYGELLACAAFVWALFVIEWRSEKNKKIPFISSTLILLTTAVLLAHNIYATLLFPSMLLYGVLKKPKYLSGVNVATEFLIAFGLSAFFWIPSLLEKKYIIFDDLLNTLYLDHFNSLMQLVNSNVTFGISIAGTQDTLSLGIGATGVAVLGSAALYILQKVFPERTKLLRSTSTLYIAVGLVCAALFIFLQLPISKLLWQYLFILPYFQFPWRFLGPLTLVLAAVGGFLWHTKQRVVQILLLGGLIIHATVIPKWYWPSYSHFEPAYYFNYQLTSTILDELRPKTFSVEPWIVSSNTPEVQGSATVSDLKWRGTYRTYSITTSEPTIVVEPTMYFLGWKVWANGQPIDLLIPEKNPDAAQKYKGQVAFSLPAGTWQIRSQMTQQTPARLVGNSLSIASSGILVWLLWNDIREKLRKNRSKI